MALATAARVILGGSWNGGPFEGEIFQTGISMVEGDAGGVFPGGIKATLPTFDVRAVGDASDTTTWRVDWAWEGVSKLTKADQEAIAGHALSFWNVLKGYTGGTMQLDWIKLNALLPDGKVFQGANVFDLKTPVVGTKSSTFYTPAQIAVVASLRTGARGPGGRGRMYLPNNAMATSMGQVDDTARTAVLTGLKQFIENIYAEGPVPAVVNAGPQTYSSITSVAMGNYLDVQRKRRNAIDETYTTLTITH